MKWRHCVVSLALALWLAAACAAVESLTATASEPRAFGYSVGDLVVRSVTITAPPGLRLDESSLPRVGRRGGALGLRALTWRTDHKDGATRYTLRLEYQIYRSPPEVRTYEMPALRLRFEGGPRPEEVRIEPWPVTVAPLVPVEVSPRQGLGAFRPDATAPLIDTSAARARLIAYGLAATLLIGYLGYVYLGLPWRTAHRRPFARAWRFVRGLSPSGSMQQCREAFQRVHEALNATAGQVVFEQGVDRFVATHPRYARLRGDLALFFQHSRQAFFSGADAAAVSHTVGWLVEFCRRCRDIERGSA